MKSSNQPQTHTAINNGIKRILKPSHPRSYLPWNATKTHCGWKVSQYWIKLYSRGIGHHAHRGLVISIGKRVKGPRGGLVRARARKAERISNLALVFDEVYSRELRTAGWSPRAFQRQLLRIVQKGRPNSLPRWLLPSQSHGDIVNTVPWNSFN